MNLFQLDWQVLFDHTLRLFVAYFLALPIGWDREQSKRQFGLRTFPLVAVVTCGFMLVGIAVIDTKEGQARIIQGIITGIGFIGGGAILKDQDKVAGTASAASIWNTGAIGLAIAFGRLEIAIILSVLNFLTLQLFRKIKDKIEPDR
jgi:putative Mg2+ transporter-C (MgtC) family protein